ncbi:MAG: alpha/beta hydrolase [Firmicutes bacterium]|nr:alpha/beta hydrolase [Bacillota bacterium]
MDTSKEFLLFLHGWGGNEDSFEPILPFFRRGFTCLTPSFIPKHPWCIETYTDLVEAYLDGNNVKKCHIIAHSFGARVTVLLLNRNPDRFDKVVLTGAAGIRHISLKARWRRLRKRASPDYLAMPLEGRKTFQNIVNRDLTPEIANIKHPTLLIFGKHDKSIPVSVGRRWRKLLINSELTVYNNSGHFPFIDESSRFIRDVNDIFSVV